MMIHRILKETLHGVIEGKRYSQLAKLAAEAAEMSSLRERVSVDAERAVEKKMKAAYMSRLIGEQFEGVISSVVSAGFFVELENTIEGYVPAETLLDDYYIYDEKNYRMIGERSRRVFAIGNRAVVQVDQVNTISDEIDFLLIRAENMKENSGREAGKNTAKKRRRRSGDRRERDEKGSSSAGKSHLFIKKEKTADKDGNTDRKSRRKRPRKRRKGISRKKRA